MPSEFAIAGSGPAPALDPNDRVRLKIPLPAGDRDGFVDEMNDLANDLLGKTIAGGRKRFERLHRLAKALRAASQGLPESEGSSLESRVAATRAEHGLPDAPSFLEELYANLGIFVEALERPIPQGDEPALTLMEAMARKRGARPDIEDWRRYIRAAAAKWRQFFASKPTYDSRGTPFFRFLRVFASVHSLAPDELSPEFIKAALEDGAVDILSFGAPLPDRKP